MSDTTTPLDGENSDEYTPTTEGVWGRIAEDTLSGEMDETRAQFDRWLAGVKAAARDEGAKAQAVRTDVLEAAIRRVLNLIGDIGPEARRILTAALGGGE